MSCQIVVIAGGDPSKWPDLAPYQHQDTIWVGVDRGAYYGLKKELPVSVAIGDFDSLSQSELDWLQTKVAEVISAPSEKNDTDTELAMLTVMNRYPNSPILLIGATGGRLDHYLANVYLPLQPRFQPILSELTIKDDQNSLRYFEPGNHVIKKEQDHYYLGFVCVVPVKDLWLYDAKYQLSGVDVSSPYSYASNEFVKDTTRFSFESGIMLAIQSKDKQKKAFP